MVITQAIHEADNEQEVYELLSAYLEGVWLDDEAHKALAHSIGSPIVGMVPVLGAIEALMVALAAASKRLDHRSRVLIKDVLYVFCTAFDHLVLLHRVPRRSGHTPHRNAARCVVAASSQASGSRGDACYSTAIVSSPPQAAWTQLSGL